MKVGMAHHALDGSILKHLCELFRAFDNAQDLVTLRHP